MSQALTIFRLWANLSIWTSINPILESMSVIPGTVAAPPRQLATAFRSRRSDSGSGVVAMTSLMANRPPRSKHSHRLSKHSRLVWRQVDHTVRQNHIDTAISDRQMFDFAGVENRRGRRRHRPDSGGRAPPSPGSCQHRSRGQHSSPAARQESNQTRRRCQGPARSHLLATWR